MTLVDEPTRASQRELAGLADIGIRRAWLWGWFLGTIPVACGVGVFAGGALQFVMITWMAVWLFLIVRHGLARCPRCGSFFNWSWRGSNPFTQRCMSCGLRLDAELQDEGASRNAT